MQPGGQIEIVVYVVTLPDFIVFTSNKFSSEILHSPGGGTLLVNMAIPC